MPHNPKAPLFGCTNCHEDYSWPADDLRVHEDLLWCGNCWSESRWDFESQPTWCDLDPFVPEEQQLITKLVKEVEQLKAQNDRWHAAYVKLTNNVEFTDNGEPCYVACNELMREFDTAASESQAQSLAEIEARAVEVIKARWAADLEERLVYDRSEILGALDYEIDRLRAIGQPPQKFAKD
jgi:hypothetical protein